MANISLTTACNRSCAFCFAGDTTTARSPDATWMPVDRFEAALDFLVRSHIPEARLLGGEPTLHPDFPLIVDRALARGLRVLVFSGGLIPERALEKLESVPDSALGVLLNVIPPEEARPAELLRQEQVLRRLGSQVILGVTIDSPAVRIGFLLELIERLGLVRSVRLGLAHPALSGSNSYLHPRDYAEVGRRVTEFGLLARERGIGLEFDCGWVPCMFPPGALDILCSTAGDIGLRCSPILDLLPDGRVISCYPLAAHAEIALSPDCDAQRMRTYFSSRQEPDRRFGLYRECDTCEWRRRGECAGGCLAGALRRLQRREFTISVPADN